MSPHPVTRSLWSSQIGDNGLRKERATGGKGGEGRVGYEGEREARIDMVKIHFLKFSKN